MVLKEKLKQMLNMLPFNETQGLVQGLSVRFHEALPHDTAPYDSREEAPPGGERKKTNV